MKIISICNQKGGVGKTTTTMNLAAALVQNGLKVLCIDLDSQGNLSGYLGYETGVKQTITDLLQAAANGKPFDPVPAIRKNDEGIYYIPSDIRLSSMEILLSQIMFREQILSRVLAAPALQQFDYILIDCLPSLGILLTNALIASNGIIIPVQAQQFAREGLDDLLNVYGMVKQQGNPNLKIEGVLLTMTDNTVASRLIETELRKRFGDLVFEVSISRLVEAVESTIERRSLVSDITSRLGGQYADVAEELIERMGENHGKEA
jgi:chromosome partitioning protein